MMAGYPATEIPIGKTQSGLPVGIQIIGPAYSDNFTIHLAKELSSMLTAPSEKVVAPSSVKGEALFKSRCTMCHTYTEGGVLKQGPNLYGLFGRTAGTTPGYSYTDAMKSSGVVWTEESLSEYIMNPRKYIPKTKMNFPGFKNPQDRADVLSFLQSVTQPSQIPNLSEGTNL